MTADCAAQWNISDYFSHNQSRICTDLPSGQDGDQASKVMAAGGSNHDLSSGDGIPAFDALWMELYGRLSDLCVDQRPAVRKSAGQTLFSMIAAHGALLKKSSWQTMLWKVTCLILSCVHVHVVLLTAAYNLIVTSSTSLSAFRRRLKTELFSRCFGLDSV